MAELIRMPRMSDTMTEALLVEWHKKVGDKVKPGDVLAEVETDKATMELESYNEGTLLYLGVEKGKSVKVDGVLAIVGKDGEDYKALLESAGKDPQVEKKAEVKAEKTPDPQPSAQPQPSASAQPQPQPQPKPATPQQQPIAENTGERIKASPLAKKLAEEKGIDIASINGTGDGGRITKKDVTEFKAPASAAAPATVALTTFTPVTKESFSDTPLSQMRKTIARRLAESKFAAPHFYLTMEINMDNVITSRETLNELSPVKISFNDIIIKACAMALRQHPAVNSSWMGDFIRQNHHIHIGSAVAVPDGLIVPVIKFADQKSLSQIAAEAKELYAKAKDKKLQPEEFSGNTFTISNLGMMDIEEFTAIINPPDSCILAIGKINEVVVRKNEGFDVSNRMKITLSCDHRSVDGAVGAAFLQTLKKFIEDPVTMLV
jgi:pyruvate dehydrogenase E2 component (dihydrolipoamide acetyltransferase)